MEMNFWGTYLLIYKVSKVGLFTFWGKFRQIMDFIKGKVGTPKFDFRHPKVCFFIILDSMAYVSKLGRVTVVIFKYNIPPYLAD